MDELIRYLLIDALTMTMVDEGNGYRIDFVLLGGERPIPRQRIEFIFVTVIGFCRWIARADIRPCAIELAYSTPSDLEPYSARCPSMPSATA